MRGVWAVVLRKYELIRPRKMNPNFSILRISLYSIVCFGLEELTSSKYQQFLSNLVRLLRVQGSY